ncbi:hypothetical protein I302_105372 [Kwoniella bestiolae CBS 10118]|uniref:ATP-binding cassette, subfamily B (MDR/TAP), member 1 n=1 Tax=Kwoniella bestiolae CBS 10118 TaxID=1296100 RepID=A0A1B9FSY3_9TREE|nr:ATP-binding cassette, subfamily B (MDR/TAP), member 1 [Kwoniella bestiolae CBS 10118]OCF21875.1 ATP-binding cassette, subfamily B (MDR/TAP), member 1 [Kwoniella bestiolae CBS 10118]
MSSPTSRQIRSPSSSSRSPRVNPPSPAFSRPPSITNLTNSRYPLVSSGQVRNLTTPSPPRYIPSTPPQEPRPRPQVTSPTSTLTRAVNTALPLSPSGTIYYSSPPSAFPSHFEILNQDQDYELTPITPRRIPPSISSERNTESSFHDRHSIQYQSHTHSHTPQAPDNDMEMINDDDPFKYSDVRVSGGKQRTMPGYQFSSLSPRAFNEKGEKLTFEPMLDELTAPERPISEYKRSLYPSSPIPQSTYEDHPDLLDSQISAPTDKTHFSPTSPVSSLASGLLRNPIGPVRPSFRGLFALSTAREYLLFLIPATIFSILSALIAPYMSLVIGDAFAIFASYPFFTELATDQDKSILRDGVRDTSLKLTIAGLLAVIFNYFKGTFWVWYGESVAAKLREMVYEGVQNKSMEWFDLGMGMRDQDSGERGGGDEKTEAIGVGGLMSKFTRETDDVRLATAMSSGAVVMNLATFILCFILAMIKAPILALVTLSTIPLVVLTQMITQVFAAPLHASERRAFAEASTSVERVTTAISTVKVHNAQQAEEERFLGLIGKGKVSLIRQGLVWGISSGMTDFLLLGTFVLGFWYGAKIVRDEKATSGEVMTCFWACLFSATYLQQIVPHLTGITKGKNSMASLLTIIKDDPTRESVVAENPFSPTSPSFPPPTTTMPKKRRIFSKKEKRISNFDLRGIVPVRCHGEFNFSNISFCYPSRPENLVLRDISLFIPPGETTFIVGGSGSGKSTIAQILLRLYKPLTGEIIMDNQNFSYIDQEFTKQHIAAVQQGCILFDMSIHDNVALGLAGAGGSRRPKDVSREEVVEVCKMAMIHDFIESLPEGYETQIGSGGNSLSGGQRQRVAIARAMIRDPTVLILDEATSALDPTSRIQVFQNLKKWRTNKTTIVITHDLSQIVSDDFVYVMSNGIITEQGFRVDLMNKPQGVFAAMAAEQAITPFPIKRISDESNWQQGLEEILGMEDEFDVEQLINDRRHSFRASTPNFARLSAIGGRPGSAYMDILDDYSHSKSKVTPGSNKRLSNAQKRLTWDPEDLGGSRPPSRFSTSRPDSRMSRRSSSFGMDQSPHLTVRSSFETRIRPSIDSSRLPYTQPQITITPPQNQNNGLLHPGWTEKDTPNSRTSVSLLQRRQRTLSENLEDDLKATDLTTLPLSETTPAPIPSIGQLMRLHFPALPNKYLLLLGCLGSIGHGITTPVWSFFLAKLMQIVGSGGVDTHDLTKYGLIVLALCAAQGLCDGLAEWALVSLSARWSYEIRKVAFDKMIKQDKSFYDESINSSSRLVQILIKDADDARTLMSQVIGKSVTVITMIGLGLIWAMVVGWQLTLIGLALGPLFGGFLAFNSWVMSLIEVGHKAGREAVARTFHESISNIRGIRAMALDSAFQVKFQQDAARAKQLGDKTAWTLAMGGAVASALPLFAQALMNFAGSEFMIKNIMNYEQMLQVYNLALFSLTFGSGMLDFIPTMAKARVASRDFNRLYLLPTTSTDESKGDLRFPIKGSIKFDHVNFSYPTRPDVPILQDISFTLQPGECVAIVGPSGCGKSTISSLIQRLYAPTGGKIILEDKYDLQSSDTKFLRNNISVVSQSTNLFDQTIAENISYGYTLGGELPISEIQRSAKLANIHEFIMSLPKGYDTNLGENAGLISGGQAQRLQIARALFKNSNILILDECTSALDVDNTRVVLDTIVRIKDSRTTIFITHSTEAMRRCDRIICLGEGRVVEDGTYSELINKGGFFAQLMSTGEWE